MKIKFEFALCEVLENISFKHRSELRWTIHRWTTLYWKLIGKVILIQKFERRMSNVMFRWLVVPNDMFEMYICFLPRNNIYFIFVPVYWYISYLYLPLFLILINPPRSMTQESVSFRTIPQEVSARRTYRDTEKNISVSLWMYAGLKVGSALSSLNCIL